jgi:hypothetical protein
MPQKDTIVNEHIIPEYTQNDKTFTREPRINRSTKLRKYASVYKSYVRKTEQSRTSKSPRRIRHIISDIKPYSINDSEQQKNLKAAKTNKKSDSIANHTPKKSLNSYQKFVQSESKKEKYKFLPGKERLTIIADEWKKLNK